MLPSVLCEHLCSLNPNVDRLAFSCIFKVYGDGTLVDEEAWFGRTVIRSCCKLDYATAQRIIEGEISFVGSKRDGDSAEEIWPFDEETWERARRPIGHSASDCCNDVLTMHSVAVSRREKRLSKGALALTRSKLHFKFDADGNPCGVSSYTIRDSNRLVEEFMLLANYLVAEKLLLKCGTAAFLRHHPEPKMRGLTDLKAFCDHFDFAMDTSSAMTLQSSLREIVANHTNQPEVVQAISALLTHPMNLASYSVAGNTGPRGWRHYALAIPYYTHFTSPIRRYADVVVHRLLHQGLSSPEDASAVADNEDRMAEMRDIARNCNDMKANAKAAQERSDRVYLAVFVSNRPLELTAVVIGMEVEDLETASFDSSTKVMTIKRVGADAFTVKYLTTLIVRLTAKKTSPIDVMFSLLGKKSDYHDDIVNSVSNLKITD